MSNVYTVAGNNLTVANAANVSLVALRAATAVTSRASMLEILRAWVTQRGVTTGAQQGIQIGSKASAFGTFVSATPSPQVLTGPASGISGSTSNAAASAGVNASAEGAGTFTALISDVFNILNGYLWIPTPEERIIVPPDVTLVMRLDGAAATLAGWSFGITFRELN